MTFEAESEYLYQKKIEELQAEVERLQTNSIHSCHDECARQLCVLRRQRDKLTEGLREIVELGKVKFSGIQSSDIARQTLKEAGLET